MIRRKHDAPRGVLKTTVDAAAAFANARFHPNTDLEPYVEHHWTVAWDLRGRPPQPVATLPHPSVHLVFETGDRHEVTGPCRARFSRLLADQGAVFAVKFRPGGFRPFLDGPVADLADRVVPIAAVFGEEGEVLGAAIAAAADTAARVALVEAFLRARMPARPDPDVLRVAAWVARVAAEPGIVKVTDLAARAGVGARTLQRLFAEYVGVGPKWVIQRYRLHEAAARLEAGPVDHATLAFELGYSDQAHFIRDFKRVVGETPAAYAQRGR